MNSVTSKNVFRAERVPGSGQFPVGRPCVQVLAGRGEACQDSEPWGGRRISLKGALTQSQRAADSAPGGC